MSQEIENEIKSTLVSRNVTVLGKRTSVRLEPEMWSALREIAQREKCKVHDICSLICLRKNDRTSLTAAIRVFLMLYYKASSTNEGHQRAGHGSFENMMHRARASWSTLQPHKSNQAIDDSVKPERDRNDRGKDSGTNNNVRIYPGTSYAENQPARVAAN